MASISLLGEKIELARKKLKLSQARLAEMVGVSRASISLYETGEGAPSYKVLTKLSDTLGLSLPALSSLSESADYSGSMITREGFDEMNSIRSYLIKENLRIEERYIEIDFLIPSAFTETSKSIEDFKYESDSGIDMVNITLGNDPTRDIDLELRWPTLSVLEIPNVDYTDASVFIVKDNKMGTRYPEESRHVFHPIKNRSQWKYLTGLHGFFIKGRSEGSRSVIIRRITANKVNFLDLTDAEGNLMSVLLSDITMIWKVGQTVHMPPEELSSITTENKSLNSKLLERLRKLIVEQDTSIEKLGQDYDDIKNDKKVREYYELENGKISTGDNESEKEYAEKLLPIIMKLIHELTPTLDAARNKPPKPKFGAPLLNKS